MILQHIVEVFDTELDRLHQLREIVISLGRPSVISAGLPLAALVSESREGAAGDEAVAEPKVPARRAARTRHGGVRDTRPPRAPKVVAQPALEPSALRGLIPKGPVVVPAAQARAQAVKTAARSPVVAAAPPVGSLGTMIRALRLEPS